MVKSEALYVVVVGCGRIGSRVANRLSGNGHSVVVIDRREQAFDGLTAEFGGFRIEGNATELSVLKQAKLHQADVCIATTQEDNVNLMVAQVAERVFSVPLVLAQVYDPKRKEVYERLGIRVICPNSIAVESFLDAVERPAMTAEAEPCTP